MRQRSRTGTDSILFAVDHEPLRVNWNQSRQVAVAAPVVMLGKPPGVAQVIVSRAVGIGDRVLQREMLRPVFSIAPMAKSWVATTEDAEPVPRAEAVRCERGQDSIARAPRAIY